jgi:hypothetical protein
MFGPVMVAMKSGAERYRSFGMSRAASRSASFLDHGMASGGDSHLAVGGEAPTRARFTPLAHNESPGWLLWL